MVEQMVTDGTDPHAQVAEIASVGAGGTDPRGGTEGGTDGAEVDLDELFEERAAIMEYDGHLSREEAERLARVDVDEAGSVET
jgi:hypothetical protein